MAVARAAGRMAWVLVAALAACGGGGGGTVTPPGPTCGNGALEAGEACDDGNLRPGDGCSATCQVEPGAPAVVTCRTLAALPSAACQATAGGAGLLVTGTVLVPGTVYRGGQVRVDAAGEIACVGCDCEAGAAGAARVTCPGGVISPGLVNLRDHLTYTQSAPFTDGGERWEHRHEWRLGLNGHQRIQAQGSASADQVRWGELRQLLGGATAIAGAGGQPGLLRNLDVAGLDEGLGAAPLHLDAFPLGDSGGTLLSSGCGYPAYASPAEWAAAPGAVLGVGEGSSAAAHNELTCTAGTGAPGGADLTGPRVLLAKTVGAGAADLARLAATGTALVWSPRSNVALYGDTAPVVAAARLGVQVALATDWLVTGSSTMQRELACADQWNGERLGGFFSDEQLWLMATRNAADAAGLLGRIGLLAPGRAGDLLIVDGRSRTPHRAVLEAGPGAVALVVRGGKALTGDAALVAALRPAAACDAVEVCGVQKRLCLADEVGLTFPALGAAAGAAPQAFACGVPTGEPTCVPRRPAAVAGSTIFTGERSPVDRDGDGLPDGQDDCPTVFNPVRPMDGGAQADADGDGVGDACDPCPLDAHAASCTPVDPDDLDGDGIGAALDDCPGAPNPDQLDADLDGHGDACDACPLAFNPGAAGCPATIYQVKDGTLPAGTAVALAGALVTGRAASGFFIQVKPGDPGDAGADFSGLFVPLAGAAVAPGDRVTVSGVTADFFGQRQLVPASAAAVEVTASGEAPPDPVEVTAAEVATGGPRAEALEGVLVRLATATVTDVRPAVRPGDAAPTGEFVVDDALRVDDLLFPGLPTPSLGEGYRPLTGVLARRHGDAVLEPRAAADLVIPFGLGFFDPAPAFLRLGAAGATTIPAALTVSLTTPAPADTFVAVASADPASLAVVGGGVTVPAGQRGAPVLLDALKRAASVTLTASFGARAAEVAVRVVDPAVESPALALLEATTPVVPPGGIEPIMLTLDLPPVDPLELPIAATGGLTCPVAVTVPADQVTASFSCVAPDVPGLGTVTVGEGGGARSVDLTISSP